MSTEKSEVVPEEQKHNCVEIGEVHRCEVYIQVANNELYLKTLSQSDVFVNVIKINFCPWCGNDPRISESEEEIVAFKLASKLVDAEDEVLDEICDVLEKNIDVNDINQIKAFLKRLAQYGETRKRR